MESGSERLLAAIRLAAETQGNEYLTYDQFRRHTGIPMSAILSEFDSWRAACKAANVSCGTNGPENLTPHFSRGKDHALGELRRVAALLDTDALSKSMYDSQAPEVRAATVALMFGGWANALEAAGLQRHDNYRDPIDLDPLARDFLAAYRELERIPTVHQVARRSESGKNTFTRKFGGYVSFKREAIARLLSFDTTLTESERDQLAEHLAAISSSEGVVQPIPAAPHHRGRHLGFRAFAFAPTYEGEVVSLFSVVAEELGFEIVSQRPAFPDCEARRRVDTRRQRYAQCLIEFELSSSDYMRHKHPLKGCDLIVCWRHDWSECPLEVLELQSAIKRLPGWK